MRTFFIPLLIFCAMLLLGDILPGWAEAQGNSSGVSHRVFADLGSESGDRIVNLRWGFREGAREGGVFAGVRVYRLLDGDEIRFGVEPLKLIEDVGVRTSVKVSGLRNGSRVIFILQAHGRDGQEVERVILHGFPGSRATRTPPKVANIYTAAGPWAISVFWDPLAQVNIAGYEVLRRLEEEKEFILMGRMSKVVGLDGAKSGAVISNVLPEIRPTMFRDKSALPGLSYVYQVRAVDADGKIGAGVESGPVSLQADRSPSPEELLLLTSPAAPDSRKVALHYAEQRGTPKGNILEVSFSTEYAFRNQQVLDDVRDHLLKHGLAGKIRVIVPCYGIPLGDWHRSLDSMLVDLFGRFSWGRVMGTPSPVFDRDMHHDPSYGLYLVSRLDGPSPEIAMALVDKAIEAEKSVTPLSGKAFFTKSDFGQNGVNAARRHGLGVYFEDRLFTKENMIPDDTMWFFATGHDYQRIRRTPWPLGSVAGYLKSNTLGRIRDKAAQYWVQGFLEEGVTATYGSVIEPYVQGYTRGDILLDRFWTGEYTFAEAYSMATPTVRWAMCAVGDPLFKLSPR